MIFLAVLTVFVGVVVGGTIQHVRLRRETGEQILRAAEEKLKVALKRVDEMGELAFREQKNAQDVVELFDYKEKVKKYKKDQLEIMRRAGADPNQSGPGTGRHENGEDWFEMPSGENLLLNLDRSQEITIRNDNADHTQVYRTLNVPHRGRNGALSPKRGSGAIYL